MGAIIATKIGASDFFDGALVGRSAAADFKTHSPKTKICVRYNCHLLNSNRFLGSRSQFIKVRTSSLNVRFVNI